MTRPILIDAPTLPPRPRRPTMTTEQTIAALTAALRDARARADEEHERAEDVREVAVQLLAYVQRYAAMGDEEAQELVELAGEVGVVVAMTEERSRE